MLRKWAVLLIGALAVSVATIASASAIAQPAPALGLELSSRAAVVKYLASHGFDAKKIVIQRGARNYAGPHCPGRGWTCTTSKRVVQISFGANVSAFQCTPSSGGFVSPPDQCVIFQSSTYGTNSATCTEGSTLGSVSQSCQIFQTTTTGSNMALVKQQIDTSAGVLQFGSQDTGIDQESVTGSNQANVTQSLKQSTTSTTGGTQKQDGYQTVSIVQHSETGTNNANVDQSLALTARAANVPVFTQLQNTDASYPNTATSVRQTSTNGVNYANLNQNHNLDATVSRITTAIQQQGAPQGGILGHVEQDSAGVSTAFETGKETQNLHSDHVTNLTQTQYGPMYYGSPQQSNPSDRYFLSQASVQNAGPGAFQDDQEFLNCDTSGICNGTQSISQDGKPPVTNTCSASSCHTGQTSTDDGGVVSTSTCNGLDSETYGACPPPPTPPPPPEID